MVEIDGACGEGGGQTVRTSLALSAITGKPFRIVNLRAKREKPGLQAQHLASVQAAAAICAAELQGAEKGSSHLTFTPQSKPLAGSYFFDIKTAGSAPLVIQTVLLPLMLSGGRSHVRVIGGTYNPFAPTIDYLQQIYMPALRGFGGAAEVACELAGYYPRGGGVVELVIDPAEGLVPARKEGSATPARVEATVVTSSLPGHVGERGAAAVRSRLMGRAPTVQVVDMPAMGVGAAVLIAAKGEGSLAGFVSLGERGKPMERVVEDGCNAFTAWADSGVGVDEHLADQLVLPACLAKGESSWTTHRFTEHLRTVCEVVQQFIPVEIVLEQQADGSGRVSVCSPGV